MSVVTVALDNGNRVPLTDAGNAELFAQEYKDDLRWVPDWNTWLRYDGKRWERGSQEDVVQMGIKIARDFLARAAAAEDPKTFAQHALKSESVGRLEAMVRLARGMMSEKSTAFDSDHFALNVENGTIDLRTGKLRPHRRDDMITKLAPVVFDPDAEAPLWWKFLERILPDPEVRRFVQQYLGYSLTGSVVEQVLAFFQGGGDNGKTTLLEVSLYVMGEYAKTGAPDLLLAKFGEAHPTEHADLQGARKVVCQEVEAGARAPLGEHLIAISCSPVTTIPSMGVCLGYPGTRPVSAFSRPTWLGRRWRSFSRPTPLKLRGCNDVSSPRLPRWQPL